MSRELQHTRQANVVIAALQDAPWNPRAAMDDARLSELVASIADCGVLVPIVVREVGGKLQVVCGHRRVEACRRLGLVSVQAVIYEDLDDDQARLIALVENVQREDLTPMDEAKAYRQMLDAGMPLAEIAVKVARSKSSIYQRLKLLELSAEMIKAVEDGEVLTSAAVLIANIPDEDLRREAEISVLDDTGHGEDGPLSLAWVKNLVQRDYSCNLDKAAFDTSDATLRPDRGACGECPHRTGNQADLFGGALAHDSPDMCTDPPCFREKAHISAGRALQKHADKGLETLDPAATEEVFQGFGSFMVSSAPYVKASEKCYEDPQHRTFAKLMKGTDVKPVAAADATGKVHLLYPKAAAKKALKTVHGIGVKPKGEKVDRKAEALRKQAKEAAVDAVFVAIRGATVHRNFAPTEELWKMLATEVAGRLDWNEEERICRRLGMKAHSSPSFEDWIEKSAPGWSRALFIEMLLADAVNELVEDKAPVNKERDVIDLAFGIDLAAVANAAIAEVTGEQAAAAPEPKKASRKRRD